jgi:hypothetical protein
VDKIEVIQTNYFYLKSHMSIPSSVKIPSVLWESLEISLLSASKRFLKKVSEVLHVDEKELLRAVLPPGETIKIILYETEDIRECQAWIAHPDKSDFVVRCRKAIIPGEDYCSYHKHSRPHVQNCIEGAQELDPIVVPPDIPQIWLVPGTTKVINAEGKIVGSFNPENNSVQYFSFQNEPV